MNAGDIFMQKFLGTIFAYLIPGMIVAGFIGIFKRDVENWIVRKLRAFIHGEPTSKTGSAVQGSLSLADPPCCPKCRARMVERTARRGEKRGQSFWGCSTFPSCHGTRSMT